MTETERIFQQTYDRYGAALPAAVPWDRIFLERYADRLAARSRRW